MFNDPFAQENIITPESVNQIHANSIILTNKNINTGLPRVRKARKPRVARIKFEISKDLKSRLRELLKTSENENAQLIAQSILNLKYEPDSGYNYLGLSNADFTKISYLDKSRALRYKNEVTRYSVIDKNSKLLYQNYSYFRSNLNERTLAKRNIKLDFKVRYNKQDNIYKPDVCHNGEMYFWYKNLEVYDVATNNNTNAHVAAITTRNTYIYLQYSCDSNRLSSYSDQLYIKPTIIEEPKVWDKHVRYHTSIGKIIRKLFTDTFNDRQITDFAEEYRKLIVINLPGANFEELTGEDIKNAYYEDSAYASGQLGNSCMRHSRCQKYFKIYTENSFVSLATIKMRGKIAARSIIWKIGNTHYFDRIYAKNFDTESLLENILLAKNYISIYRNSNKILSIPIPRSTFDSYEYYPYLDTFKYYDKDEECLVNTQPEYEHFLLNSTTGNYNLELGAEDRGSCDSCSELINLEDLLYSDITDGHYCYNCANWSDLEQTYVPERRSITLYNDEIVDRDNDYLVELLNGSYGLSGDMDVILLENDFGYTLIYDTDTYVEVDGNYYHLDDVEGIKAAEVVENEEEENVNSEQQVI